MTRRRDIEWKHCFLLSRFGPHSREAEEAEITLRSGLPDDAILRALDRIYVKGTSDSDAPGLHRALESRRNDLLPLI